MNSRLTGLSTEDLETTVQGRSRKKRKSRGARNRHGSADGRGKDNWCLREVLEDEVDDEGHVEPLVVGRHNDAVRALAARRRFHRRQTWSERRISPSGDLYVGLRPQAGRGRTGCCGADSSCLRSRCWGGGRRRRDEPG
jgi:hypothetical protein